MANIPTREKQIPPQSRSTQMPPRPAPPQYNRPPQYGQHAVPPRAQQPPRINSPGGNVRPSAGYPARPLPPRASAEQLRPIKGPQKNSAAAKKQATNSKRKKDYTKLKDFLLSFTISLVLFGIAAIIVCNALISLFT